MKRVMSILTRHFWRQVWLRCWSTQGFDVNFDMACCGGMLGFVVPSQFGVRKHNFDWQVVLTGYF